MDFMGKLFIVQTFNTALCAYTCMCINRNIQSENRQLNITRLLSDSEDLQSVLKPLRITMEVLIAQLSLSFRFKTVTLSVNTVLSSYPLHTSAIDTTFAMKNFLIFLLVS